MEQVEPRNQASLQNSYNYGGYNMNHPTDFMKRDQKLQLDQHNLINQKRYINNNPNHQHLYSNPMAQYCSPKAQPRNFISERSDNFNNNKQSQMKTPLHQQLHPNKNRNTSKIREDLCCKYKILKIENVSKNYTHEMIFN